MGFLRRVPRCQHTVPLCNKPRDSKRDREFSSKFKITKLANMSDLPALQLFEEIQGLSNSMDFFSYTKEDLNKTWSLYDDDSNMESKEQKREEHGDNILWQEFPHPRHLGPDALQHQPDHVRGAQHGGRRPGPQQADARDPDHSAARDGGAPDVPDGDPDQ